MIRSVFAVMIPVCAVGCVQSPATDPKRDEVERNSFTDGKSDKNGKVEAIVREVIAERFKVKPQTIDMKRQFSDPPLNADPLDLVQVAMTLEERFVLEIPDKIIEKHGGAKLGEKACKLSPLILVKVVEESQELAAKKKK